MSQKNICSTYGIDSTTQSIVLTQTFIIVYSNTNYFLSLLLGHLNNIAHNNKTWCVHGVLTLYC